MFKTTTAETPEEYIDLIEEPRKSEIKKLHEFIKKTLPNVKPYIETGMIGYGKFHYKSKSGREGDWALIGLASQKNYISVYVCAAVVLNMFIILIMTEEEPMDKACTQAITRLLDEQNHLAYDVTL